MEWSCWMCIKICKSLEKHNYIKKMVSMMGMQIVMYLMHMECWPR